MSTTRPWPLPPDPPDGLRIHHLSDTHFGYRAWSYAEGDHMQTDLQNGLIPPVDLLLHTGDIIDGTDNANTGVTETEEDSYAKQWLASAAKAAPSLWCMGNHDVRSRVPATRAAWQGAYGRAANTFIDVGGYRIVTFAPDVDSNVVAGQPGWWPTAATWAWLDETIQAAAGPVVVATHMPPWELGVSDTDSVQPPARYDQLVADHPNIVGIMSGHMHWVLDDTRAARFVTMGGRVLPVLTDISSMLSLGGTLNRDQSAQVQSYSAYVTLLPDRWEIRYRAHGTRAWSGPGGLRVTTMDLTAGTVTHGMG